ncbi:hypothetical protein [Alysiella filiformis]|uniref:hypothetical protein n=1 Tax=Alysiella filiformis TaxID=194196 RepID=UPI0015F5F53E|nr:hypothetical protein [Alysiella filiformis]QMT32157.1 hypothetical protein H3L97_04760 [Alysiella filiformis]UBQ56923.1 hypothetical protein JF568_03915 [Alysiella filiformis DSM 16848]
MIQSNKKIKKRNDNTDFQAAFWRNTGFAPNGNLGDETLNAIWHTQQVCACKPTQFHT